MSSNMDYYETKEMLKKHNSDKSGIPKSVHVLKDEFGEKYEVVKLGDIFLPNGEMVDMIGNNSQWVLKDEDVVVVSYPKTGTHWVNNLINYMFFEGPLESAVAIQPMMLEFHIKSFPEDWTYGHIHSSHMKPHLLPPNTFRKGQKLILVVRNPKDVAVSLYHHLKKERVTCPEFKISWSCFLDNWIKTGIFFFNYFEFYKEWLQCIEKHKDVDILIVHYEELKKNGLQQLRRIQEYLGLHNSDDRLRDIVSKGSIKNFRADIEKITVLKDDRGDTFLCRKGVVGDWKNHFTVAQNERMDELIAENFKDTIYHFESMSGY